MLTLIIAAAAAAAQPAPAPSKTAQAEHAHPADHKDMDCGNDCCKDMAKKHEGHTGQ